jgi:hypothetical protein
MSGPNGENDDKGGTRGDYQSVPAGDDILELKKAVAQGVSLDGGISQSPVPPVLSYCAASIMMTVVNKVRVFQTLNETLTVEYTPTVCCIRERILHEFPTPIHPICRLRGLCMAIKNCWFNIISRF